MLPTNFILLSIFPVINIFYHLQAILKLKKQRKTPHYRNYSLFVFITEYLLSKICTIKFQCELTFNNTTKYDSKWTIIVIDKNWEKRPTKGPKYILNWEWKFAICTVLYGAHHPPYPSPNMTVTTNDPIKDN